MIVEGEALDGFHLEIIPQLNTDNKFDRRALSSTAGMRAVWLLYLAGKWDYLEDLGVDRELVEPKLKQFQHYGRRLTTRQAQQLRKKVPEFVEASRELRLAYALKRLDEKEKSMVIYHAEVASAELAEETVKTHKAEIEAAGGTMEIGFGRSGSGAIVMVKLPSDLHVQPENLLSGSGLRFSKVRAQVVQVPRKE